MMTKKHYEAIAAIINNQLHIAGYDDDYNGMTQDRPAIAATLATMTALADYLITDNRNFDRDRFIAACKK